MESRGFSTKQNGRRNEFSSRLFKSQGSAYFFLAFLAGAFLAAAFFAGFFAASFFGAAFFVVFLVAIDNPPFQSAVAGRVKFLRVSDECHQVSLLVCWVMKLCYTVNEFFLAHVENFSFARGEVCRRCTAILVARIVPHARESFIHQHCGVMRFFTPHKFFARIDAQNAREKNLRFFSRDELRGALNDVIHAPQTSKSFVSAREHSRFRTDKFRAA
jgi:hypothetical protein